MRAIFPSDSVTATTATTKATATATTLQHAVNYSPLLSLVAVVPAMDIMHNMVRVSVADFFF